MTQVVETFPYERMSHAVVAWVDENLHRCDVIHVHEWGGVFVDLATLLSLRQVRPGRLLSHAHAHTRPDIMCLDDMQLSACVGSHVAPARSRGQQAGDELSSVDACLPPIPCPITLALTRSPGFHYPVPGDTLVGDTHHPSHIYNHPFPSRSLPSSH